MGDERTLERVAELKILKDDKNDLEKYIIETKQELKELSERPNTAQACFSYNVRKIMEL